MQARTRRVLDRVARRPFVVGAVAAIVTAVLAIPLVAMPPSGTASQEPTGAVFTARDRVDARLAPSTYTMFAVVEARDGDLLRRAPLRELRDNAHAVREDPDVADELLTTFDPAQGRDVTGLWTIADRTDAALRERGVAGLDAATDAQVRAAASALVDAVGPIELGLSQEAARDPGSGLWTSPAATVVVLADAEALGGATGGARLGTDDTTAETWARDVQTLLRGAEATQRVWGVAIDVNLTSAEQGQAAGPFIGVAILGVLALVALVFRSYWAVALVGSGLGAMMVWLLGTANLLGFESDQVLSTIVPIALVSFGVDFAFHAIARVREEQAAGARGTAAVAGGLAAVLGALVLALASDAAAFLSNVTSDIQSIVQLGYAASIGLLASFVLLGLAVPLVMGGLEARSSHGGRRRRGGGHRALAVVGGIGAAATATAAVLLTVFVAPGAGVGLLAVHVLGFVVLPGWWAGRGEGDLAAVATAAAGRSTGRWARSIGAAVAAVGRRPALVLPVAMAVTAVAATAALRIETVFDVRDFFSADTDFVQGLDALDEHVGEQGGEPAVVYVETDLADPAALRALDAFADRVAGLDTDRLARDDRGQVDIDRGVVALVRDATRAAGDARDADADGLPDDRAALDDLYGAVLADGVAADGTRPAWTSGAAAEVLWRGPDVDATRLVVGLPGTRDVANVEAAREVLQREVDRLESDLAAAGIAGSATVTGTPIARTASLDAVAASLQRSLPIAVVLCLLIGAAVMRSLRLAAVSVVPILLVVAWLYGLMQVAGFGLNLVTATIGAVSIGIGIDFAIHFVLRYREELGRRRDANAALRATGESTGTALVASAASSILGFAVLAFAPMPLFATYGLLTAAMIAMALVATLVVLPALLVVAVPASRPARPRVDEPPREVQPVAVPAG